MLEAKEPLVTALCHAGACISIEKPQDTRLHFGVFQNVRLRYWKTRRLRDTLRVLFGWERCCWGKRVFILCTVLPGYLRCRACPPVSDGAELSR